MGSARRVAAALGPKKWIEGADEPRLPADKKPTLSPERAWRWSDLTVEALLTAATGTAESMHLAPRGAACEAPAVASPRSRCGAVAVRAVSPMPAPAPEKPRAAGRRAVVPRSPRRPKGMEAVSPAMDTLLWARPSTTAGKAHTAVAGILRRCRSQSPPSSPSARGIGRRVRFSTEVDESIPKVADYLKGQLVSIYSQCLRSWVEAEVMQVLPDGSIKVLYGYVLSKVLSLDEQRRLVKPVSTP
eukprot:CAMPEP_0115483556 /NCGR_PEP_ID=MMETSP0271-20121206/58917_1 /TAXON_ID=71861 /ORGANISM="Scrippsiella trochoidea, Strain CCMP3099" /LENGTH=243 /DNA_ID=CAMNT_0002911411 /DNA_START=1 /DNA_END=732 /DNA_ORIENTATION=+